jgi:hypothetical protein
MNADLRPKQKAKVGCSQSCPFCVNQRPIDFVFLNNWFMFGCSLNTQKNLDQNPLMGR